MIRCFETTDRESWRKLWQQYLDMDGSTLDEEVHEATWKRLLDAAEPVNGAMVLHEGAATGFVHFVFHRSTWSVSDACYLQDLFVSPGARGRGLGSSLVRYVGDKARANGAQRIHWQTQSDNEIAMSLYDKIGERSPYVQYCKSVA